MNTKRQELITALISGLKIEKDIYAIETVKESTEFLKENQYLDFYQEVMKEDTYSNGVKAVMKIAEQFKPININELRLVDETKADEVQAWTNVLRRGTKNTEPLVDDEIVKQLIEAGYLR